MYLLEVASLIFSLRFLTISQYKVLLEWPWKMRLVSPTTGSPPSVMDHHHDDGLRVAPALFRTTCRYDRYRHGPFRHVLQDRGRMG